MIYRVILRRSPYGRERKARSQSFLVYAPNGLAAVKVVRMHAYRKGTMGHSEFNKDPKLWFVHQCEQVNGPILWQSLQS